MEAAVRKFFMDKPDAFMKNWCNATIPVLISSGLYRVFSERFRVLLQLIILAKNKNSAVCVKTPTVNVNTFSTTVKDEILEGR